jgi:hypothetical protein
MEAIVLVKKLNKLKKQIHALRSSLEDEASDSLCVDLQDQGFVGLFFFFFLNLLKVGKLTDALFLVSTPDDATLNLMDELDTAVEEIIDELSQPGVVAGQLGMLKKTLDLFQNNCFIYANGARRLNYFGVDGGTFASVSFHVSFFLSFCFKFFNFLYLWV